MPNIMNRHAVASATDVDALWKTFLAARQVGDEGLAQAVRDRMAHLEERRQMEEVDDDQLRAHIRGLKSLEDNGALDDPDRSRELEDLVAEAHRRRLAI